MISCDADAHDQDKASVLVATSAALTHPNSRKNSSMIALALAVGGDDA